MVGADNGLGTRRPVALAGESHEDDAVKDLITKAANRALGLLFPLLCLGCGKEGKFLCDGCVDTLPRLALPHCPKCAHPGAGGLCNWCKSGRNELDGVRARFLYTQDGLMQKAITEFKFHNMRAMAPELGQLLAEHLRSTATPGDMGDIDIIVPVPSHPLRLQSRGFNQAALLGRELGKLTRLRVNEKLMVRTKNAPSQFRMVGREERWANVLGNFSCTGDGAGQSVLLVDDIVTTGATMSACAKALKDAGFSQVWGLAVARTA